MRPFYNIELDHRYCLSCAAAILDVPITDFVVSQCAFPQYADRIVQQLRQGYDEAKEMAEANKRQLAKLTTEIEKRKENLAYTKTPQQVDVIFALIDTRMKEREHLTQVKAYPAGRVGDAINIEKVTNFLTNIQSIWPSQPDRFKNEFLRIILDRILITAESDRIRARIIWKTGMEQEILIHRAPAPTLVESRWTEQELKALAEHFSSASWSAMMRMLPSRGYFAILEQAQRLKLKRKSGPWSRHAAWSAEEDELARAVAAGGIGLADVVEKINRTPRAVYARIKELGISYSKYGGKKGFLDWELVDDGIGNQGQHLKISSSPTRWFSPAQTSASALRRMSRMSRPSGAR